MVFRLTNSNYRLYPLHTSFMHTRKQTHNDIYIYIYIYIYICISLHCVVIILCDVFLNVIRFAALSLSRLITVGFVEV